MPTKDQNLSAAEHIRSQLEQMIASGDFENGSRLDENRLARHFGVSRTPLREAFRLLSALGLVDLQPNRGAFVKLPDFAALVDMFEVMAGMEAWCARLAATRITRAQLLMLEDTISRSRVHVTNRDVPRYYEVNATFHELVYDASGNAFLAAETRRLQRRLKPYRLLQLGHDNRLENSVREHVEVFDALAAHDSETAARVMENHVRIQSFVYDQFRNGRMVRFANAGL